MTKGQRRRNTFLIQTISSSHSKDWSMVIEGRAPRRPDSGVLGLPVAESLVAGYRTSQHGAPHPRPFTGNQFAK